ncbi:hypothetical protein [Streptomyces sp. NBC_00057]|uniref:hypothetical protein n=1 Tax=Streptomyces sp. NBC_00057 TaxID=2975634 RepID=UPI0032520663
MPSVELVAIGREHLVRDRVMRGGDPGEGVTDQGRATGGSNAQFRSDQITARLAAWNAGDVTALTDRLGSARLQAPGLSRPLTTAAGKTAYLKRLFEHADVQLKAGQVAFGERTTYVEWHGKVTSDKGADVPFGIVERFGPRGSGNSTSTRCP